MTHQTPLPGTIGLVRVPGLAGLFITLGQLLIGDTSRYTHAFIALGDGTLIESMPRGARIAPLSTWPADRVAYGWMVPLTDDQRARVVAEARALEGTPYGFLDYVALGLARFGARPRWLRRRVTSSGRMICSQLVDEAYRRAGVTLFPDGRLAQDVTPGDLANLFIERGDWVSAPPPR
jgi:cell wall-associated NlpC family hydrolase